MNRELFLAVILGLSCAGAGCASSGARFPRTPAVQPTIPPTAAGPTLPDARRMYDAGKYGDVVNAVNQVAGQAEPMPALVYLAAQSSEKLGDANAARTMYQRLAGGGATGWADIGRSGLALLDKRNDEALSSADSAAREGSLPEAHYQRGLVLMARMDFDQAAASFDRATSIDPSFAAAHYYGGLAEYRMKRIDRMAAHFEAFLRLAPDAPERGEVESIMRTVR